MKKKIFYLSALMLASSLNIVAQEIKKIDFKPLYSQALPGNKCADLPRQTASLGAICDTLVFDNQLILLDQSPLVTWNAGTQAGGMEGDQAYSAVWEIVNGKLCLSSISFKNNDASLKKQMEKQLRHKLKKGMLLPFSGELAGGSDCIKTESGYAAKNRYIFLVKNGMVNSATLASIPYGSLERGSALESYLQKNIPCLIPADIIEYVKSRFGKQEAMPLTELRMICDAEGKASLALNDVSRNISLERISKDKTIEGRVLLNNLYLATRMPAGAFYGRFLKGGAVYPVVCYEICGDTKGRVTVKSLHEGEK